MRRKLLTYWLFMSFLVFMLFLAILYAAGVFSQTARRLNQDLTVSLQDTGTDVTEHFDMLAARSIQLSKETSEELSKVLGRGEDIQGLCDHPSELEELEQTMLPALSSILRTGRTLIVPVKEDDHAWRRFNVVLSPLSSVSEPLDAIDAPCVFGDDTHFDISALIGAP